MAPFCFYSQKFYLFAVWNSMKTKFSILNR